MTTISTPNGSETVCSIEVELMDWTSCEAYTTEGKTIQNVQRIKLEEFEDAEEQVLTHSVSDSSTDSAIEKRVL
jgi:hypothetical protein